MPVNSNPQLNKSGNLAYGKNVIISIITLAAKEISGVANLLGKGVRIDFEGNIINIDVFIGVYYGGKVSDVAFKVQENVKRSVETMTGYKTGTVNVNILGVKFSEEHIEHV